MRRAVSRPAAGYYAQHERGAPQSGTPLTMPAVLCALTTTAQTKCGKAKSEQRKRGGFGYCSLRLDFGHAPTLEAGAPRERYVER